MISMILEVNVMIICSNCGHENEDNAKFCGSCGFNVQNLASSDSHIDFEPDSNVNQETDYTSNIDSQPDEEQFNNQQQFNNQPVNYQQSYQNRPHKNMWIAVILDIIGGLIFYFLCGIGQIYLGLVKRGIVLGVCGLAISILNVVLMFALGDGFGSIISLILGLALLVYSAYDAYLCTNAINEGNPIPLLFGSFDFE